MASAPQTPSFQTVRLMRGRHASPDQGVCVMELASMLAGERFTDHPRSVSPVIAEFLRTYNDLVDDDRRQDLYRFAAASVGTRSSQTVERLRADWLRSTAPDTVLDRLSRWLSMPASQRAGRAQRAAAVLATNPARHRAALALVDELIAIGSARDRARSRIDPARRVPHSLPAAQA